MLLGCVGVGGYLVAPVRLDEALEIETLRVCGLKLVWRGPPERAKARCTGRLEAKLWQGGARRELAVEHASGCFLRRRRGQRQGRTTILFCLDNTLSSADLGIRSTRRLWCRVTRKRGTTSDGRRFMTAVGMT